MSAEKSEGGSRIYRHETPAAVELVAGDEGLVDAVDAHVERHFGKVDHVVHELVSPYVHVDLQLARLPHEFQTLLWQGHTVPNGDPALPYARNTKLCGALVARC